MDILVMLASAEPRGLDPEIVKPGWIALGIVVALCLAVVVLARSFSKHTRRANQPWEGDDRVADAPTSGRPTDERSGSGQDAAPEGAATTAGGDEAR